MSFQPKKVLIVGPAWVGDIVMAQSLFIYLKQKYPTLIIDVLAPAWSKPMLTAMPEIRQSIEMPLGHGKLGLGERFRLGKSLRKEQYDWSITLPNSWKSAVVPFVAKIPKRTGYTGEARYGLLNDRHKLDKKKLTMTVQRFVALAINSEGTIKLENCPEPHFPIDAEHTKHVAQEYQLSTLPLLALCPGAEYGPAKCWPSAHYAELANHYIKQGYQVALLGSKKDCSTTNEISNQVNHSDCHNLASKTSLHEAILLLALAKQVVSNDSGLMHVAAAVGSSVVAIYGSSDPKFTPPLSGKSAIAHLNLECSPCFKRECPLGHLDCLNNIKTNHVIKIIEKHDS